MSAQSSASRSGDAPLRWRTAWGWGLFFALLFAGVVLFWRFVGHVPVLHQAVPPR